MIPLSYQDSFQYSLDVEANIVSLCSNCHNQIHYGKEADELIKKLFNIRKVELDKAGLYLSVQELLDLNCVSKKGLCRNDSNTSETSIYCSSNKSERLKGTTDAR